MIPCGSELPEKSGAMPSLCLESLAAQKQRHLSRETPGPMFRRKGNRLVLTSVDRLSASTFRKVKETR